MNQNTNVSSSNANSNVNNNTNIAQAQGGAGGFANVNISGVAPAAVQPVVVQPAPVVVARQAVPVAQVSGVSFIKQLPATGLPEIALASLGLIPLGSILKAYKSGIKGIRENHASYIWEKRQFNYHS
ncbi:MAG: hypothetical protein HYW45_02650 [Candidatus Daviesbacteria bacterium]|nr:MAG: hypothetical protein HYW45_02650 [Candidatus Daviesbacteria bacterium]